MNEQEEKRIESVLRGMAPARPPADFMARLVVAKPSMEMRAEPAARGSESPSLWLLLRRWLVPVTALAVTGLAMLSLKFVPLRPSDHDTAIGKSSAFKADEVHIDEELLSAFDAVGLLPSGEPVRFRCQQWMDQIEVRDKARGLVVQQRAPRLQVVPVSFETY
jgi:hypothetical protein